MQNIYTELKTIKITVDKLPILIKNLKRKLVNLVTVGGYISEKSWFLKIWCIVHTNLCLLCKQTRKSNLIYSYRSNQKKTNTETEKKLLKNRYEIEHVQFCFSIEHVQFMFQELQTINNEGGQNKWNI